MVQDFLDRQHLKTKIFIGSEWTQTLPEESLEEEIEDK